MPVYLKALGLKNYRGIGNEIQTMPAFKTFNFFIGANNAGKSTVLNFISKHLPSSSNGGLVSTPTNIDPLELHGGQHYGRPISVSLGFTIDEVLHEISLKYPNAFNSCRHECRLIVGALANEHDLIWTTTNLPYQGRLKFSPQFPERLKSALQPGEWATLWNKFTGQSGGDIVQHWIPQIVEAVEKALDNSMPTVRLIPAIRQIGPKGIPFSNYSGAGLVDRLAEIQNPEHHRRKEREKFDKINQFLQLVTGRPSAEIEVPYSRDHILVHMDGRVLPLSSLGTGIQEVIMIAAFCTLAENEIICIEEPEIHLHPLLQRKLVRYLGENTVNQYFIATHSAAFIDTAGAAIFHVSLENDTTHIREAILKKDLFAICMDLGHRASDIVQANAIVWVEGPSDRIYVKHWIDIVDSTLVEGIHYSIMFYGGRLLSHLSANDEEVSEFIQLRTLNRHIAIMMDSDKAGANTRVNATKHRLKEEFKTHGGVAWITKGREVENYIDYARLQHGVKSVYGSAYKSAVSGSSFDHALYFERVAPKRRRTPSLPIDSIEREVDKVKVSRAVVKDGVRDLDVLDLRERVMEVLAMIRSANT